LGGPWWGPLIIGGARYGEGWRRVPGGITKLQEPSYDQQAKKVNDGKSNDYFNVSVILVWVRE